MHCRLRDAIHVDKPNIRMSTAVGSLRAGLQGLAAEDHRAHRRVLPEVRLQRGKGGWGLAQHRDGFGTQHLCGILGRAHQRIRHHHGTPAGAQRCPHLPHRKVKGEAVADRPHVLLRKLHVAASIAQHRGHVGVCDGHALRPPCGAGGVDHVGDVIATSHACRPTRRWLRFPTHRLFTDHQDGTIHQLRDHFFRARRHQHSIGLAILEDQFHARLRRQRIHGNVSAGGHRGGQDGRNLPRIALHEQGHSWRVGGNLLVQHSTYALRRIV